MEYEIMAGPVRYGEIGAALDAALAEAELDHQTLTDHAEHVVRAAKDLIAHGVAGAQHEATHIEVSIAGRFGAHRHVDGEQTGANSVTIRMGTAIPPVPEPERGPETVTLTTGGFMPTEDVEAAKAARAAAKA